MNILQDYILLDVWFFITHCMKDSVFLYSHVGTTRRYKSTYLSNSWYSSNTMAKVTHQIMLIIRYCCSDQKRLHQDLKDVFSKFKTHENVIDPVHHFWTQYPYWTEGYSKYHSLSLELVEGPWTFWSNLPTLLLLEYSLEGDHWLSLQHCCFCYCCRW